MDGPEGAGPRVDVFCLDDGTWVWSYRSNDVELTSNRTFENRAGALASARRAYPHLPEALIRLEHVPHPSDRPRPMELIVGVVLIVLAWRHRRRL